MPPRRAGLGKHNSAIATLSRGEQVSTMARLCWVFVDRAAARDALARRQVGMIFNSTDQHIERVLCMRLDKFELRECQLEGFDVVAVLHLVEAVSWDFLVGILARCGSYTACIGASIIVNRQQRIHRASDGDERSADAAGGAKLVKIFSDIGYGQSVDIDIIGEPAP